jgi:uracil-DNA glycosylase
MLLPSKVPAGEPRGRAVGCAVATLAEVGERARACTRCALAGGRTQVVFGVGNPEAELMFVGEGPGQQEDIQGEPFVGRSGQFLDRLVLDEMGLTRDDFYIANTVKCRPPGNRDPLPDEIEACSPWLDQQLDLVDPSVVVTLGNFASRLLLHTTEGITKLRGRAYPFRKGVLIPTFHPAAVLRGGGEAAAQMRADLVRAKRHLRMHAPRPQVVA